LKNHCLPVRREAFFMSHYETGIKMYELFIEVTNQLFWEGYAEQLAKDNPEQFQRELAEFINLYND
jgi:hypothetical protein